MGNQAVLSLKRERQKRRSQPKEHHGGLRPRASVHKAHSLGGRGCRDVTQGPDAGAGSPESASGRPGPLQQSEEEMGQVQSGAAAGLASTEVPVRNPKLSCFAVCMSAGDPLLQELSGDRRGFRCWRCPGSDSRGGAVLCPGARVSPSNQASLGDPLCPCVCD